MANEKQQRDSQVNVARITAWQTIAVALVSAAAGIITTLISTNQNTSVTSSENSSQATENIASNTSNRQQGVQVLIFWHPSGFTSSDAKELQTVLVKNGIPSEVRRHPNPQQPDSVFIGALVPAEVAKLVLGSLPYTIEYIFKPDYPEESGGKLSGLQIGVGYTSSTQSPNYPKTVPVEVSENQLNLLSEQGISNTEFQRRLRIITDF